jgi:hypothetical protein
MSRCEQGLPTNTEIGHASRQSTGKRETRRERERERERERDPDPSRELTTEPRVRNNRSMNASRELATEPRICNDQSIKPFAWT